MMKKRIYLIIIVLSTSLMKISCNGSQKKESEKNSIEKIENKTEVLPQTDQSIEDANLENIFLELPEKWVYNKVTTKMKESWDNPESGFTAIAANPIEPDFSVTVWKYKVNRLEALLPLFERDIQAIGASVTYTVKNSIVYGETIQKPMKDFKWKGKSIKKNDSLFFFAVGCYYDMYESNQESIDSIFNSIHVP